MPGFNGMRTVVLKSAVYSQWHINILVNYVIIIYLLVCSVFITNLFPELRLFVSVTLFPTWNGFTLLSILYSELFVNMEQIVFC